MYYVIRRHTSIFLIWHTCLRHAACPQGDVPLNRFFLSRTTPQKRGRAGGGGGGGKTTNCLFWLVDQKKRQKISANDKNYWLAFLLKNFGSVQFQFVSCTVFVSVVYLHHGLNTLWEYLIHDLHHAKLVTQVALPDLSCKNIYNDYITIAN